ncbi:hypothetical protein COO60DRAFT_1474338 [Scenedesmus sp. NREL 46B-D3]|nr:hypothetical protein COO60DRAFT_1474338 [Scenedesmus sp. NREL 46B-D3]
MSGHLRAPYWTPARGLSVLLQVILLRGTLHKLHNHTICSSPMPCSALHWMASSEVIGVTNVMLLGVQCSVPATMLLH